MESLRAWESFYVIVGSSAGALTGLQFVVVTLIAEARQRTSLGLINTFGTPTVAHFVMVLLISSLLSAPWPSLRGPQWVVGIVGVAGIAYTIIILRRTQRVAGYRPVLEDWMFHVVLPAVAYVNLLAAGFILLAHELVALFMIGATNLLLLFIGIHNSWDTVTFIVAGGSSASSDSNKT